MCDNKSVRKEKMKQKSISLTVRCYHASGCCPCSDLTSQVNSKEIKPQRWWEMEEGIGYIAIMLLH